MGQHGVVVLLAQDGKHLRAGFPADKLPFCNAGEQRRVVARRGGAKPAVAVKVQRIVQHSMRKAQLPDAGVDGIQSQIVDNHIGGNVVRANDHHGGGVLYLELCAHAQRAQHTAAVHELALLIGDLFGKVCFAALRLQIQCSENKRLDGGCRLKFFVRANLHGMALQVVHEHAHFALIAVQLRSNALFQRHVFIHIGIFSIVITGFPQKSAWHCGSRCLPPRPQ